jgi:predicted transcriptional regulator YdeE
MDSYITLYEVSEEQDIPDGMIEIRVPELTYVKTTHHRGNNIQKTYTDLHKWLFESDYTAFREAGVDYYDPYMPIKYEHYPVDRDSNDPHFEIYIPIIRK